jgi:hypothetical protein
MIFDRIMDHQFGNPDLCKALAWLLAQDSRSTPLTWSSIQSHSELLRSLQMNDARFSQLKHWGRYLGLGWACGRKNATVFVPDPTEHIRKRLFFKYGYKEKRFKAQEFFPELAEWCPVLDGGRYQQELRDSGILPPTDVITLTPGLSQALLRLQDEGSLALEHASDAKQRIIMDGDLQIRVSAIVWKGEKR